MGCFVLCCRNVASADRAAMIQNAFARFSRPPGPRGADPERMARQNNQHHSRQLGSRIPGFHDEAHCQQTEHDRRSPTRSKGDDSV